MTLWQLIKAELKAVLTNPVVTLTVFGGVVFYSFLYPLPYAQQTPREQTIAIVNLDGSQTSLKLERMVDATPTSQRSHSTSYDCRCKASIFTTRDHRFFSHTRTLLQRPNAR